MAPASGVQAISDEIAAIHARSYERELLAPIVTRVSASWVTCRLALALSPADEKLLAHGNHDIVHAARDAFEGTLSLPMRAAVERATGRTVLEHTSHTDLDARITIEAFRLAAPMHAPLPR